MNLWHAPYERDQRGRHGWVWESLSGRLWVVPLPLDSDEGAGVDYRWPYEGKRPTAEPEPPDVTALLWVGLRLPGWQALVPWVRQHGQGVQLRRLTELAEAMHRLDCQEDRWRGVSTR